MRPEPNAPHPSVTRGDLFLGFVTLGLVGFGGIAPWARHVIVERRRWLNERDYAAFVGMGQVLPGSNTINAAVLIGQRFHGATGAAIAVTGLMTMPLVVLVGLALLYQHIATQPDIQAALSGASAAAAGMVIGTAVKMAWRLKLTVTSAAFVALACIAAAWLTLPLLAIVAALVPLSILATAWSRRQ